jgi:NAD(P)-dependent dehydrogenase (short-subunit alcohol dehydrogenase family)
VRRVALVTGASRGLGRALATFLAQRGFDLVVTARGLSDLRNASREFARIGVRVEAHAGDVRDGAHRERLRRAAESLGRLDVLVNNASDLGPSPLPPLARYPLDAFASVLDANVLAPLGLLQECLPLLEASHGLVVNVTSDAAAGGYPGWGGYGASKAALELVSRTLATELAERRVGVVTVDPGDMRTRMHQDAFPGEDISDRPPPDVTIPFWAWLFGRPPSEVNGRRYRAQSDHWEVAP